MHEHTWIQPGEPLDEHPYRGPNLWVQYCVCGATKLWLFETEVD